MFSEKEVRTQDPGRLIRVGWRGIEENVFSKPKAVWVLCFPTHLAQTFRVRRLRPHLYCIRNRFSIDKEQVSSLVSKATVRYIRFTFLFSSVNYFCYFHWWYRLKNTLYSIYVQRVAYTTQLFKELHEKMEETGREEEEGNDLARLCRSGEEVSSPGRSV